MIKYSLEFIEKEDRVDLVVKPLISNKSTKKELKAATYFSIKLDQLLKKEIEDFEDGRPEDIK